MFKVMDRYVPDWMYTNELEINRENVFFQTKIKEHQKQYITAMTATLIINHGAVEFKTLNELEYSDESESGERE